MQSHERADSSKSAISFGDLHTLCEVTDEQGSFLRSTFSLIDAQDHVYFGQAPIENARLQEQDLSTYLKQVADDRVYPEAPPTLTRAKISDPKLCYIKRPKLTHFCATENDITTPTLLLQEAETMERLSRIGHPNIIRYHGCIFARGRLAGLVFDRHPMTLETRLSEGARGFDKDRCLDDIRQAVAQLHALGLAHNDLNPSNVLIDKHDHAILIDFGSCRPYGEMLITAGTPGWVDDEDFCTSERVHDEIALKKIAHWLGTR